MQFLLDRSAFYFCLTLFTMQGGHNAMLTFNPSGGLTQKLTVGVKGAQSSNGNLSVKCGLWKKGHHICTTP